MTLDPIETPSGKNAGTENFPVGSLLLRADVRPHVHAYYIFARAADDISDNPLLEPEEKIVRLDKMGAALLGQTDDQVDSVRPLRKSLVATGVTAQHSLDLLTAFKRDATQLRYLDWADLMDYCRFSAAPVGRHVLALHGIGDDAWGPNDALCSALQIINHIQDCADDYRELDRVYIPQDMMLIYGATTDDLSEEESPLPLRQTLDDMLDRVEPLLDEAHLFPGLIPDTRLKMEVSVITTLAERIVKLLRRRDPLCDNVKLGKGAVLAGTLTGIFRTFK